MTATDRETTVLHDVDFAVPCENPHCDDVAEWVLRWRGLPCCTPLNLVCSSCLQDTHQWLSRAQRARDFGTCKEHGGSFAVTRCWRDIEPLKTA